MNKIHRAPRAALVLFSIILFAAAFASLMASCTDSVGIFASLSQEKPIGALSTKELSSVSPACVVRYNVAGIDNFFMSSGNIYKRPLTLAQNSWTAITSRPEGASRCTQIAANDRLYAAWLDDNFSFVGLYASSDAINWTAIALPSESGIVRQITGLFTLNTRVFVSVKQNTAGSTNYSFKLYYINIGDDNAVGCGFETDTDMDYNDDLAYDSTNPYVTTSIRSMTWDGTNYWFVSGSSIFRGNASFQFVKLTELSDPGVPGGMSLTSISWSADLNRILVSTGSGVFKVGETMTGATPGLIYARTAAGVWETSNPSVLVSSTSGGYANFTDLITVPDNAGAPVIVASAASSLKYGDGKSQSNKAAAARGYGVLVPDAGSIIGRSARCSSTDYVVSTWPSYEISLMDYAITGLAYLDGETGSKVLFACTAGSGLWSIRRSPEGIWEEDWQKE